jgi:SAM-dependent methyltransferase
VSTTPFNPYGSSPAGGVTQCESSSAYTPEFFKGQQTASEQSAREVVPLLLELTDASSVVDVGCGIGTWARVFADHAVKVLGIDGDYVNRDQLRVPVDQFVAKDLAQPIDFAVRFDLAICLEVAEHLPSDSAESLVSSLCSLAPVVAFSAAVPGQGGVRHLNEQWPEYWAALFSQHGYVVVDCIRDKIWMNEQIVWHYRQNMLIFVREDSLPLHPQLQAEAERQGLRALSVVHPGMYAGLHQNSDPRSMSVRRAFALLATAVVNAFRRRVQ